MDRPTRLPPGPVHEWMDHLSGDTATNPKLQSQKVNSTRSETPLCDGLIARGVLPDRNAPRDANATQRANGQLHGTHSELEHTEMTSSLSPSEATGPSKVTTPPKATEPPKTTASLEATGSPKATIPPKATGAEVPMRLNLPRYAAIPTSSCTRGNRS